MGHNSGLGLPRNELGYRVSSRSWRVASADYKRGRTMCWIPPFSTFPWRLPRCNVHRHRDVSDRFTGGWARRSTVNIKQILQ